VPLFPLLAELSIVEDSTSLMDRSIAKHPTHTETL
jgi:hypothetical protein